MKSVFCLIAFAIYGAFSYEIHTNPFSDEFINYINGHQNTWEAGRNFDNNTAVSHIRSFFGAFKSPEPHSLRYVSHSKDVPIPGYFDSRENWPNCKIISVIRDQSACGSSWAVAATSAMSDRICIHSNGKKQIYVSDEDLLSCCAFCGNGCNGGSAWQAWNYWRFRGLVSGGPHNSTMGCRAYSLTPCQHHTAGSKPPCPSDMYHTPKCIKQCDEQSSLSYDSEKSFGQEPYRVRFDEEQIQLEIMKNGPVEATFHVFEDFLSYKNGVYKYVSGEYLGEHSVRILGWGVNNGTPYWLVANSWNEDWGDKGLFKIFRGDDDRVERWIESDVVAALPQL